MRVLILIILSFLLMAKLSAQKVLTLDESISIAIKNNIEVAQREVGVDVAKVNRNGAKAALLPTVNGVINQGVNRGRSIDPFTNSFVNQQIAYGNYGLGSDVMLFNGLTLQHAIKQNGFAYDAAKMDLQQAKDNLTLAVMLAYLQVLSNEEQEALAQKQVSVAQLQLERLEKLNKEGAINPPQVYDLRGQLKESELAVVTAKNAVASSKLSLTQLLTIPFDPALQLEKLDGNDVLQRFSYTPEEIYGRAVNSLAVVKAAAFRKRSAEAAEKAAKGALLPSVGLSANLNTNFSSAAAQDVFTTVTEEPTSGYVVIGGTRQPVVISQKNFRTEKIGYTNQIKNNVFSNVGLTVRLPIFNSFAARNRMNLAAIEVRNTNLQAENIKVELRAEIDQAYVHMNNAGDRYKILSEQVEAYAESFRAAEVRLAAGVGSSLEYLVAKGNLDRAAINQVAARYDLLLRKKILEFYMK